MMLRKSMISEAKKVRQADRKALIQQPYTHILGILAAFLEAELLPTATHGALLKPCSVILASNVYYTW